MIQFKYILEVSINKVAIKKKLELHILVLFKFFSLKIRIQGYFRRCGSHVWA